MKYTYPDWATEKQVEGMKEFVGIASEYGDFSITFSQDDHDIDEDAHSFYADVKWSNYLSGIERDHRFHVAFDYEATWDRYGDRVYYWQFLFSGGEATREMTTEVFFLDLFMYLDRIASK